ncbi:BZ3500_MvSof-1268-A1-R1_Chr2-2g04907 [Microbotryum saponariae]|uniref:BZ3500_MvSof-1268-A1-R1_Chr2-2g04907 protein n=1 Tax=Microbotryum saponariae TaxID=289078 RepID=A0A2X0KMY7_9BASI|nr:BZ3500_MvSof-1268-A1-R1_Chr2-2g04907 [Microbotryum saponariae]SDA00453.1 BZ3501_MvSof-1269-A2-R1_Chr2-2g04581 [Microbotryum saponariae]
MSFTQTRAKAGSSSTKGIYSLPLTGAVIPPSETALLRQPLQPSGAIASRRRTRLTPAIGVKFHDLRLREVLDMSDKLEQRAILSDLAYEISLNGVAFFSNQDDLSADDLGRLALLLGEPAGKGDASLHIHPTQELGENGLPIGKISNVADKDGRQISFVDERSAISSINWHSDITFEPRPANYSLLKMHTLPETGGDTLFSSAYAHYDALSPAMKTFLSTLTATHEADMFRIQSQRHGFKLHTAPRGAPENVGDHLRASHPVIRTNPTTGLNGLFVNQCFTTKIDQLTFDESKALLAYLFMLQAQSHDAQVRYRWKKHDLAIWDNRSTNHAATFDYDELRQGDRAVCVGEVPYFDPNAIGRKQFLGSQGKA